MNSSESNSELSSSFPSDSSLIARLTELINSADLTSVTPKSLRQSLEAEFKVDLEPKKAFLKSETARIFTEVIEAREAEEKKSKKSTIVKEEENQEENEESESDNESIEEAEEISQEERDRRLALELQEEMNESRPRRSATSESFKRAEKRKIREEKLKSGESNKKSKKPPKLMVMSSSLAAVVGASEMSRGDVVRKMWEYIKANSLQNPDNKRKILIDEKLKPLFGDRKSLDMMQMSKFLQKHMMKPEEIAE